MNNIETILPLEKIKDCIFWVGAGISYPEPTSLPLGWDLTEFTLKETCGQVVQDKIFKIWEDANKLSKISDKNAEPLGRIPRLETILGEIDDVQSKLISHDFNFLQGFISFQDAPYNENHLFIASLLQQGAIVVTTNFDLCIQKAYKDLSNQSDQLVQKIENGVYLFESTKNKPHSRLWHIHGISTEIQTLGATIKKVKEGLPDEFQEYISSLVEEGKYFIFLGYSASDSFDVNIYFQNKKKIKKSRALFIQHGHYAPPPNASLLGKTFENFIIQNHDTTNFLRNFIKSDLKHNIISNNFNWNISFQKVAQFDKKEIIKPLLTCKLANMLGINIDKVDATAYEKSLLLEDYYEKVDFHKTLAIVQRMRGDSGKEKKHDTTVMSQTNDLLGYYYSQGNFKKAIEYAKNLEELMDDSTSSNTELDWRTYTSMSAHSRPLITKHILSFSSSPNIKNLTKIKNLIKITDMLGNRPLKNVRFINQIATALRFNFLFNAMLGNNETENEEKVLHLYGEGASIIGFVSAYRDIAIKNYFLAKHEYSKSFFRKAQVFAEKSLNIAELIGENSGIKRAKQLRIMFKVISPLYWLSSK